MNEFTDPQPAAEAADLTPSRDDAALAVVPRATLNYVIIGITFLLVGVVIGAFGYDRLMQANRTENQDLINSAVAAAVAALPSGGAAAAAAPTQDPNQRFTVAYEGNPSIGPDDAPIVMIEFGDFRCGYCKRFNDETLFQLLSDYEGQVRFVYRDYPILGPDSLVAAHAGQCAHDQGAFWPFHDLVYANQGSLNRDTFIAHATALELDVERFTTCLDEETFEEGIIADFMDGQQLGVGGTPTFFINGKLVTGAQPYAVFASVFDAELAALESAS